MNYYPVEQPRRARQTAAAWTALVSWLLMTGWSTAVWWRNHPRPGVVDAIFVAIGSAVLLGAAIAARRPDKQQASGK